MRKKVCKIVDVQVYVLCVSGSDIDLMFQCEGKQNLMAKNDCIPIKWKMNPQIKRLLNSKAWSTFVFYYIDCT